jgi:hypothetical protein
MAEKWVDKNMFSGLKSPAGVNRPEADEVPRYEQNLDYQYKLIKAEAGPDFQFTILDHLREVWRDLYQQFLSLKAQLKKVKEEGRLEGRSFINNEEIVALEEERDVCSSKLNKAYEKYSAALVFYLNKFGLFKYKK